MTAKCNITLLMHVHYFTWGVCQFLVSVVLVERRDSNRRGKSLLQTLWVQQPVAA